MHNSFLAEKSKTPNKALPMKGTSYRYKTSYGSHQTFLVVGCLCIKKALIQFRLRLHHILLFLSNCAISHPAFPQNRKCFYCVITIRLLLISHKHCICKVKYQHCRVLYICLILKSLKMLYKLLIPNAPVRESILLSPFYQYVNWDPTCKDVAVSQWQPGTEARCPIPVGVCSSDKYAWHIYLLHKLRETTHLPELLQWVTAKARKGPLEYPSKNNNKERLCPSAFLQYVLHYHTDTCSARFIQKRSNSEVLPWAQPRLFILQGESHILKGMLTRHWSVQTFYS